MKATIRGSQPAAAAVAGTLLLVCSMFLHSSCV